MNIDLGRVTPIYRGEYDAAATYELNDIVLYTDGNLYWHVSATPTVEVAPTDSTVWEISFSGADLLEEMAQNVKTANDAASSAQTAASGAQTAKEDAEAASNAAQSSENAAKSARDAAMEILDTIHSTATEDAPAIVCEASGEVIALDDASDRLLQGLRVYGRTTQDGTPTPEVPVELVSAGDSGSIAVRIVGKNLLRKNTTQKIFGVDFVVNDDGSITVSGTATADAYYNIDFISMNLIPGKKYLAYFSEKEISGLSLYVGFFYKDETYGNIKKITSIGSFTVPDNYLRNRIFIGVISGTTVNSTVYPMITYDTVADDTYEPYTPQVLDLSTPNGLPGIPVTSGGNYTDADGQQWICDEVDFSRGVYVQRIGVREFNKKSDQPIQNELTNSKELRFLFGVSDINKKMYCTHFESVANGKTWGVDTVGIFALAGNSAQYIAFRVPADADLTYFVDNPTTVYYVMASPTETALDSETLAAYAALHTNKPNTTIYNGAGAHMDVQYTADTKLYIDKKINELAAAIVNNT